MKVFVAGATGVLGRRVVKLLLQRGHSVVGLSRSGANAALLAGLGAEPREASLFDEARVVEASRGSEAILHLATSIPPGARTRLSDWKPNDLIRRKGTKNLVAAALRHGCRLYVQQSVTLVYGHRRGAWVDETAVAEPIPGILKSAFDMERIVRNAGRDESLPAAILRCGMFYCHDSAQTAMMLETAAKGRLPIVGSGDAWWSLVHADDAASAFANAVDRPGACAGRTLNVCDDEPVRSGDLLNGIAEMLRAGKPGHLPRLVGRLVLGAHALEIMEASVRCRNDAAKEALAWAPAHPSWRGGFRQVIEAWSAQRPAALGGS